MKFEKLIHQIEKNNWPLHGIEIFCGGTENKYEGDGNQQSGIIFRYGDCTENRYPIYSATKTFLSTAVGIAVDEGRFSVSESLYEYLKAEIPAYMEQECINNLKKMTIERLLTMSVKGYPFRPEGSDWLKFSLECSLENLETPAFEYSDIPAYLVGIALEKALGEHLISYLTPRLFELLRILKPRYKNCPSGHFYGASNMELTVHELAKLGQLYLQNGVWQGDCSAQKHRILSEQWIRTATASHIISNREVGYGYFIWMHEEGYYFNGKWGQKCYVFPKRNLVVTYLSNMEHGSDMVKDAVIEMLDELK